MGSYSFGSYVWILLIKYIKLRGLLSFKYKNGDKISIPLTDNLSPLLFHRLVSNLRVHDPMFMRPEYGSVHERT